MASPLFMLRGAFRHPERSEMSDVRSCKGKAVRTESKDLAPHHHFAFLIQAEFSSAIKRRHAPRAPSPPKQKSSRPSSAASLRLFHDADREIIFLSFFDDLAFAFKSSRNIRCRNICDLLSLHRYTPLSYSTSGLGSG